MAKACKCPQEGKGTLRMLRGRMGKRNLRGRGILQTCLSCFIWKRGGEGGNMFCMVKVCAERWKNLPQSEKDKYKKKYCELCKKATCKSCKSNGSGAGGSAGKKC